MKIAQLIFVCMLLTTQVNALTFVVTKTNGNASWDGPVSNDGSFAGAIMAVNAAGVGPHTIAFNLGASGAYTIDLGGMAVTLGANSNITIDGFTQTGAVCASNLPVALDINWDILSFTNQTNLILRGLRFNSALQISGGSGVLIESCFFNLNTTGSVAAGTVVGATQLILTGHTNGVIGGSTVCKRNIFSGSASGANYTNSILITNSPGTQLLNNNIGTNLAGTTRLGSLTGQAVVITTSQNVSISENVISASKGSPGDGIAVTSGNCNGLQILNNYIGVNRSGTGTSSMSATSFGNYGSGIAILGGSINSAIISGNVVSANRQHGITIEIANTGVRILNNIIGLDYTGVYNSSNDLGNNYTGIRTYSATCTNIEVLNNIVCRNGYLSSTNCAFQAESCGIIFNAGTINSATVSGNKIGVDVSLNPAGNQFTGLYFFQCGNMGGSDVSKVLIYSNIIGDNGNCSMIASNGVSFYLSHFFTVSENYIGAAPSGGDVGNYANGIEVNESSNFIIDGNIIGNNKGRRTSAKAEACAGIAMYIATYGTITANQIYNHVNTAGYVPNNGLFVQKGGFIEIGSMTSGKQNALYSNGTHAIAVFDGADYVEMRYNSIYCNGAKGINIGCSGSVFGKSPGNNSFGCTTLSITAPVPPTPVSISGNRPTNSIVDVFGTNSCGVNAGVCVSQGEDRFSNGTYNPSASGVAGTSWSYNHGSPIYDNLSALATGGSTDCSGAYCRTSEFSACITNPLPVTWVYFNATLKNEYVYLDWKTSDEKDNNFFIVERSEDGFTFDPIGRVNASGKDSASIYTFPDWNPLNGISYYRLKQVDNDGNSAYSETRSVNRDEELTIFIYPNPNKGNFDIVVPGDFSAISVVVSDVTGREILVQEYELDTSRFSIQLPSIIPGTYVLSVRTGEKIVNQLLVIE